MLYNFTILYSSRDSVYTCKFPSEVLNKLFYSYYMHRKIQTIIHTSKSSVKNSL